MRKRASSSVRRCRPLTLATAVLQLQRCGKPLPNLIQALMPQGDGIPQAQQDMPRGEPLQPLPRSE